MLKAADDLSSQFTSCVLQLLLFFKCWTSAFRGSGYFERIFDENVIYYIYTDWFER